MVGGAGPRYAWVYIVLGTGYRIVVHEPYCSSSVVHQAHCCSVVTVNTKNSVQLLTLRYSIMDLGELKGPHETSLKHPV